jgi:hypothetical protein
MRSVARGRRMLGLAVVLAASAGCSDAVAVDAAHPPVLEVQASSGAVDVVPWSWCFSQAEGPGGCGDGAPPAEPPRLGSGGALPFEFGLEGWAFTATSGPVGGGCEVGRVVTAQGERYEVDLAGAGGVQDVTVVGWGEQGDLSVTVRWDTGVPGGESC